MRFRLWTVRARIAVRRQGGRLLVDAPHGATFATPPRLELHPRGAGSGRTTLLIGRNVHLGRGTVIELWTRADNSVVLDDGVLLGEHVWLQVRGGRMSIGAHTTLRDFVLLKSQGDLQLGRQVILGHFVQLHCFSALHLGDLVGLAERASILDSDHSADGSDTWFMEMPVRADPVRIGRNAFIAANVVVTRGARIGANCVVGANAVVRRGEYPHGWLVAGAPARAVRPLPAREDGATASGQASGAHP